MQVRQMQLVMLAVVMIMMMMETMLKSLGTTSRTLVPQATKVQPDGMGTYTNCRNKPCNLAVRLVIFRT